MTPIESKCGLGGSSGGICRENRSSDHKFCYFDDHPRFSRDSIGETENHMFRKRVITPQIVIDNLTSWRFNVERSGGCLERERLLREADDEIAYLKTLL